MSLFNRAEVIDQNFTRWVAAGEFPQAKTVISLPQNDILKTDLISLFGVVELVIVEHDRSFVHVAVRQ